MFSSNTSTFVCLFVFFLVSKKNFLRNFTASFPHSLESRLWITAVKCHFNTIKPERVNLILTGCENLDITPTLSEP